MLYFSTYNLNFHPLILIPPAIALNTRVYKLKIAMAKNVGASMVSPFIPKLIAPVNKLAYRQQPSSNDRTIKNTARLLRLMASRVQGTASS